MSKGKLTITCQELNRKDMVDFLSSLGFHPQKVNGDDYWYLSPLREEKTASFKINRKLNVWYDHGIGKGGSLVDFGIAFFKIPVKDLLTKLQSDIPLHSIPQRSSSPIQTNQEPKIKIISERSLTSNFLMHYLQQRRIGKQVSEKYCREVEFELKNKRYPAIGFRNDEGGFELRNQWFKGSTSPKSFTTISNNSNELSVFEGFFDFLTHQTLHANTAPSASDFIILNSLSFLEPARLIMEKHDKKRVYFDRDKAGKSATAKLVESGKNYSDESPLYEGYKDLNEWAQHMGKSKKTTQKLKI